MSILITSSAQEQSLVLQPPLFLPLGHLPIPCLLPPKGSPPVRPWFHFSYICLLPSVPVEVVPPGSLPLLLSDLFLLYSCSGIIEHDLMAQLRCCSFNCRGWNSGMTTLKHYIDFLNLCLVQEHWLLKDHLLSEFVSVGISGMDSTSFLVGCPLGGCLILYRTCITPLVTCSYRFCAKNIHESSGNSFIDCVYICLPNVGHHSSVIT